MTMQVEMFDTDRQRLALMALHDDHVKFLRTAEGAAFLEQLEAFFAPAATAAAQSWGYPIEREEVVNMILARLLDQKRQRIGHIVAAATPWRYLGSCVRDWVQEEHGHRGVPIDAVEVMQYTQFEDDDMYQDAVQLAVKLTFLLLESRTPRRLLPELKELLGFLAVNPPARLSYEHYEIDWAMRYAPSFTEPQVREVMNLTWGGRPNRWETSVLGQYARDPEFDAMSSGTHARAVNRYKRIMTLSPRALDV